MRLRLAFSASVLVLAGSWLPAQQLPPDVACRGCGAGAPRGFATLARVSASQAGRSLNPYDRPPELRLILPPFPARDRSTAAGAARIVAGRVIWRLASPWRESHGARRASRSRLAEVLISSGSRQRTAKVESSDSPKHQRSGLGSRACSSRGARSLPK